MAEFMSLWAARSTKKEKRKKGRHKEENTKELDYFSKGIDFYTDFGAPTIRDCGEY